MRTQNLSDIGEIIRSFYETYQITGAVEVRFSARTVPDSDGDSVVDVYLYPLNDEASRSMNDVAPVTPRDNSAHMQFLSDMVSPEVLGYNYKLEICNEGDRLKIDVIDRVPSETPDEPNGGDPV